MGVSGVAGSAWHPKALLGSPLGKGPPILLWLILSRLPAGLVACLPWGSPAGQAEVSGEGVPSASLCWQEPRGIQESEVDAGFVARSPAWPCTRRRLNFHCSGGATNCLDECGWVYVT